MTVAPRNLSDSVRFAVNNARLSRSTFLLRMAVLLVVFSCIIYAAGFVGFVAILDRAETEPPSVSDAIVVLTGGSDRIPDAVQLLAEGRGTRLLISGVNRGIQPKSLAKLMPNSSDLFTCCIDLDYGARNTVGNATETRRWAREHGLRSILVVTSNYHMPRALLELRRAMPETVFVARPVVPYAFDASSWWHDPATARVLISEYTKFVAAYARSVVFPVIGEDLSSVGSIRGMSFVPTSLQPRVPAAAAPSLLAGLLGKG